MINAELANERANSYKGNSDNSSLSDEELSLQSKLMIIGSLIEQKVTTGIFELKYPSAACIGRMDKIRLELLELGYKCDVRTRFDMSMRDSLETYLHIQW